jgi:hypothetical protein
MGGKVNMQLRESDKHYEKPKEIKYEELTLEKKIQHIWEYYRWHILGVIMAIVLTGYIIYIIVSPVPTYSVDLLMTGKFTATGTQAESVKEKLHTDFDAKLELEYMDWSSENQYTMNMYTKIYALATAKQLDVLILPKSVYDIYASQDNKLLIALEEEPRLEKVLDTHQGNLLMGLDKNDNKQHIYGIKLDNLEEKLGITSSEEYILTVAQSVKNIDQTVAVINYLLE